MLHRRTVLSIDELSKKPLLEKDKASTSAVWPVYTRKGFWRRNARTPWGGAETGAAPPSSATVARELRLALLLDRRWEDELDMRGAEASSERDVEMSRVEEEVVLGPALPKE